MNQVLERPQAEAGAEAEDVTLDFDALLRETRPTRWKLSAAIRAGSRLTEPGNYWFETSREDQPVPQACAIGAACFAMNGNTNPGKLNLTRAAEWFPELLETAWLSSEQAPELAAFYQKHYADPEIAYRVNDWNLGAHIMFFNDSLELSRERIADIVEALGY